MDEIKGDANTKGIEIAEEKAIVKDTLELGIHNEYQKADKKKKKKKDKKEKREVKEDE